MYGGFMDTTAVGKLMNLDTAREMANQISAPYGMIIEIETTTAEDTSESGGRETEDVSIELPTENSTEIPTENPTEIPTDVTAAFPPDDTTRAVEKSSTWFDNNANAIAVIAISVAAVGVAVGFGVLSRKGWRI